MEDTHKIIPCLKGHLNNVIELPFLFKFWHSNLIYVFHELSTYLQAFFGVYDGHGGSKAAKFVAQNLHNNILEVVGNCTGSTEKEDAIKAAFLKTDRDFLNLVVANVARFSPYIAISSLS